MTTYIKNISISTKIIFLNISSLIILSVVVLSAMYIILFSFLSDQARERQNSNMAVALDVLNGFGQIHIENGILMADKTSLNNNNYIVDHIVDLVGGTATIFQNDVRISSNVKKQDGSRAIGTFLAAGPVYDSVLKEGKRYLGQADILGVPFFTSYEPIKDKLSGKVIGILYVGIPQSDFLAVLTQLVSTIGLIIFGVISIAIIIVLMVIRRSVIIPIGKLQSGLESFFSYLNKKTKTVEAIQLHSNDELGQMAKNVNENIINIQKGIEEDKKLIDETIMVIQDFQDGDLSKRLSTNVNNPVLTQLKSVLNNMAEKLESNIDNILNILGEYSQYNYLNKVQTTGLQEHLLKLANGVNTLGGSITEMLIENKSNGITLQKSSNILLNNVDKLNQSSTEAAASLEQTAAALEEITSNIRSNTHNIQKMSELSSNLTLSAKNGEKLANDTTNAMEEIDEQVSSINEAIAVIDQIAFQTNILSLNAAVEAATAGEAGKGFAVVAAEVRNLATRSADAAKEIKNLVEHALNKANDGKSIATDMINGYKELNQSVSQTVELIKNIENSSKEQLVGIEQINDAVSSLDIQIQENANISLATKEVAISTDDIANLVVDHANSKEFEGKEEVDEKEELEV